MGGSKIPVGLLPCLLLSLNATIQDTIFEGIKDNWLKRQNLLAAAKAGVDLANMKLREVQALGLWMAGQGKREGKYGS